LKPVQDVLYVSWPFNGQMLDIPIVDVTNPRFAIEDNPSTNASLQKLYEAEEHRQAKTPRLLRALTLRIGARQSRLLHGLLHSQTGHLGGLHTYLMKLGADNLPTGFDSPIDRKVAATPHAIAMRLRLQQCAMLMAECVQDALEQSPSAPLHLLNIAGGTALDSLNALILLHQKNPALLRRPIRILVLDIDSIGPDFGARALTVLTQPGNVLSGLDLHFDHQSYDWNNTQLLADQVRKSTAAGAVIAVSAEGGLFEYANDSVILANLEALATPLTNVEFVVGSVTCSDPLRRASIKRAHFKVVPRGIEGFRPLAEQAGFELTRVEHTPLSDQVVLRRKITAKQEEESSQ
jgi:hypothetical protein